MTVPLICIRSMSILNKETTYLGNREQVFLFSNSSKGGLLLKTLLPQVANPLLRDYTKTCYNTAHFNIVLDSEQFTEGPKNVLMIQKNDH